MADLQDAYSEIGGSEYTMPTGTTGLSSYGQRVYGRSAKPSPDLDSDLQTEMFKLGLEQKKSEAVRQMRDTAIAGLNLAEKNRVEEQAGYVAASLRDLDPKSDTFERDVTSLYSKFPYGFKDPAINNAINYKRDIRKQYDQVQENMRRDQAYQERSEAASQRTLERQLEVQKQGAEFAQKKQEEQLSQREYEAFKKSMSPLYLPEFQAAEDKAKQEAEQAGTDFNRSRLMESFLAKQAADKLEQDILNAGLNPEQYKVDGVLNLPQVRKDLFETGRRKERIEDTRKTIGLLGTEFARLKREGEEIPEDLKAVYDRAKAELNQLTAPRGTAPTAAAPAAPESGVVDLSNLSNEDRAKRAAEISEGTVVKVTKDAPPITWTKQHSEQAQLEQQRINAAPAIPEAVKLDAEVPDTVYTNLKINPPKQKSSDLVIKSEDPVFKAAYPNGVSGTDLFQQYDEAIRQQAIKAYNDKLTQVANTNNQGQLQKLLESKETLVQKYVDDNPAYSKNLAKLVLTPIDLELFKLQKQLVSRELDPQQKLPIEDRLKNLYKERNKIEKQISAALIYHKLPPIQPY